MLVRVEKVGTLRSGMNCPGSIVKRQMICMPYLGSVKWYLKVKHDNGGSDKYHLYTGTIYRNYVAKQISEPRQHSNYDDTIHCGQTGIFLKVECRTHVLL